MFSLGHQFQEHIGSLGLGLIEVSSFGQLLFAVLPEVLDRIEFRAVGWQPDQVDVKLAAEFKDCLGSVDGCIVKDDAYCPAIVVDTADASHKFLEVIRLGLFHWLNAVVAV